MDWKVRYIDYPKQFQNMEKEIMQTIYAVLSKGDLMLRQQLEDFENNLAEFVGTNYAVGTSNCTDALHLSLRAAGIGPGDEVITVSHTFVATAAAIHHTGAKPVLIDIGEDHNMNVDLIEQAINSKTQAILPVHLNGRLCDMEKITNIADKHNLLIIEDSAQALGASYKDKKGGAWGLAGCFSFYPAKLLGAYGDAGAVVTNSEEMANNIKMLRNHGRTPAGDIAFWSFNCRLDNLQAALLDLKLKKYPEWIERRREIASLYYERLDEISDIKLPPPPENDGYYYDVFQNYEIEAENRDELIRYLNENGIETMLPWGGKAIHQFQKLNLNNYKLPRTEELFQKVLMLPLYPELTEEQIDYVAGTIKQFFNEKK